MANNLIPGSPLIGTPSQFSEIDITNFGGLVPDQTKAPQTFTELLTNKRVLQDALLNFLQVERNSGYRQVFETVPIQNNKGSLVAQFVGFKGGLADPNDFKMNPGTYDDARNEQTFDAYLTETGMGYFGAFAKAQKHNVLTSQWSIIAMQNQMLAKQAAVVLDNVAGEALYNGGNLYILGAYNPTASDGKTVSLLTAFPTDANDLGPISIDALEVARSQFYNTMVSLPKINVKADGKTEIIQVQANVPIRAQSNGLFTALMSRNVADQLYNDPRLINVYVTNGGMLQEGFFNKTLFNDGASVRGFYIKIIDNPITLDLPTVAGQPATLNFKGTGTAEFVTIIGGESTQDSCKEATFNGGINWAVVDFSSTKGDLFGNTYISGWCAFYGASVIDTSKVINVVCNRGAYNALAGGSAVSSQIKIQRPHN